MEKSTKDHFVLTFEGQSSDGQKAGSDQAICSMWKIKVSHKEKSMHSLYTSQHPRTFFLLHRRHLQSAREPPDMKTAKVHLINS